MYSLQKRFTLMGLLNSAARFQQNDFAFRVELMEMNEHMVH
ncbi:hypothetical protein [Bacillus coahuilensis]|nr:hypothetical protein [Bacillus coahuilensis]